MSFTLIRTSASVESIAEDGGHWGKYDVENDLTLDSILASFIQYKCDETEQQQFPQGFLYIILDHSKKKMVLGELRCVGRSSDIWWFSEVCKRTFNHNFSKESLVVPESEESEEEESVIDDSEPEEGIVEEEEISSSPEIPKRKQKRKLSPSPDREKRGRLDSEEEIALSETFMRMYGSGYGQRRRSKKRRQSKKRSKKRKSIRR